MAAIKARKGGDNEHIGEPILPMIQRVKSWLKIGMQVMIFTARVSHDGTERRADEARRAAQAIQVWCEKNLGQVLPITNVKDYNMLELWDDRTVQVEANTGLIIGRTTRGLA